MPGLEIRNPHAPLLVTSDLAPVPAKFADGQRVKYHARVTGGLHAAVVVRSRYSPFFESWLYDVRITGTRSAMYYTGLVLDSLAESELRGRIF